MRIAIVEDEAIVARRLERMVSAIVAEGSIVIAPTFHAALELIRSQPIDLLLLDLNLGGRDGFRLLEEAAASSFETIVVSAHHDQALRAFEYGVIDFVAKPWSEERLRMALDRATSRQPRERARTLVVRKGRELRTIAIEEVVFARGADDYAELHLSDGSVHLHEKTLSARGDVARGVCARASVVRGEPKSRTRAAHDTATRPRDGRRVAGAGRPRVSRCGAAVDGVIPSVARDLCGRGTMHVRRAPPAKVPRYARDDIRAMTT